MPKIPDTFCPAKWDELNVSFDTHYAYSCCKSTPTVFQDQVLEFVSKERMNLLNGIQDASCNYCWTVENAGGESLRHRHLKKFNPDNFALYQNNPLPRQVLSGKQKARSKVKRKIAKASRKQNRR